MAVVVPAVLNCKPVPLVPLVFTVMHDELLPNPRLLLPVPTVPALLTSMFELVALMKRTVAVLVVTPVTSSSLSLHAARASNGSSASIARERSNMKCLLPSSDRQIRQRSLTDPRVDTTRIETCRVCKRRSSLSLAPEHGCNGVALGLTRRHAVRREHLAAQGIR